MTLLTATLPTTLHTTLSTTFSSRYSRSILGVCLALGLHGCTMVGPDFKTPETQTPHEWSAAEQERVSQQASNNLQWWHHFNDPTLIQLIEDAQRDNLGLQIAGLRIYEARAIRGRVKGNLYPQMQGLRANASSVGLSENADPISNLPDFVSSQTDDNFSNYGVSLDAAWEIDFWGRVRRSIEAADARYLGTIADYQNAQITLSSEVATTYTLLRSLQERRAIAKHNVGVQRRGYEIAKVRFEKGISTELDVQQAKALLHNTESSIPLLNTGIDQSHHALCLLLGKPPGELQTLLTASETGLPSAPAAISVDVPAELLRRRPDIQRMELRAATQSALIGVAKADMYPAFRLGGSVGYVADSSGDLFDGDSASHIGGFGVMWKFLNYGRLRNKVRAQDARFQQSVVAYQRAVLAAAREVEDALTGFSNAHDEAQHKASSASAASRAVELAMTLYRDGVTSYTTVLDTQRVQLLQQDALVAAKAKINLEAIKAYKAMGGGWPAGEQTWISDTNKQQMLDRTNWGDYFEADTSP